jgi:hypothetical protein
VDTPFHASRGFGPPSILGMTFTYMWGRVSGRLPSPQLLLLYTIVCYSPHSTPIGLLSEIAIDLCSIWKQKQLIT